MPEVILPCPNTKCWAENNRSVLPLRIIGEQSPNNESYRVQCQCGSIGPHGETEAAAIAAWDALPRALTWTHEPPKVAGEYKIRVRMHIDGKWADASTLVIPQNMPLCFSESELVQYAGPIAPPVEG